MTLFYSTTLGIDISKTHLDLYHSALNQLSRFQNNPPGLEKLIHFIQANPVDCILFEPTGGYEKKLVRTLKEKALPFTMVHALHVRKFAQAKGKLAKTDALDAAILADYGLKMQPALSCRKNLDDENLRLWVHRRTQITKLLRLEKQALEQQDNQEIIDLIKQNITTFKKQIKSLDQKIFDLIQQNEEMHKKAAILKKEKGIGPVCLANLFAFLPELGKVDNKQIAALVGVAPYSQESGTKKGYQKTSGGRKTIRNVLYMAVISAIRYNPKIQPFYQQLIARGKKVKIALVACVRKFLVILNATLKKHFFAQLEIS